MIAEVSEHTCRAQTRRIGSPAHWWREGYWSSTGDCFDIGNTVSSVLRRFEVSGDPNAGSTEAYSAGNGSLMRLSLIPLFYFGRPTEAVDRAGEMSRTTHGAVEAVDSCRFYSGLIHGALTGASKDRLCAAFWHPYNECWEMAELSPKVEFIAAGSFKGRSPPDVRGSGYVIDALDAALWAFWTTDDFRQGALAAANLGDDADTTAAIYGQLAGAYYGLSGIPSEWVASISMRAEIVRLAERLGQLPGTAARK